ncbi:hypothetical protein KY284_020207 [Solanum tuberosum]|nr:hypothetical protein KY284_020207 [Solanum tuberosum]
MTVLEGSGGAGNEYRWEVSHVIKKKIGLWTLCCERVTTRFGGKGEGCGSDNVGGEVFVVSTGVDRREYTNRIGGFGDGGWDVDGS